MKQHAPSTLRNREPLLEALRAVLPERGLLLEIAAGSGEHAAFFAPRLPGLRWQPTDADPAALESIAAWAAEADAPNLAPPLPLDVLREPWPVDAADAVLCVNMIHISPWEAAIALFRGAGRVLRPGGVLVTYGPYKVDGAHTAPSNVAFEAWLHARDPRFGVRDVADLQALADANGMALESMLPMPANNATLVFRRS